MNCPKDYISRVGLKKRGWSKPNIDRFFPNPDLEKEITNPTNGNYTLKFYFLRKVEEVEKRDDVQILLEKEKKRKELMRIHRKKAEDDFNQMLINKISKWKFKRKTIHLEQLEDLAIKDYYRLMIPFEYTVPVTKSNKGFLDAIMVWYLKKLHYRYWNKLENWLHEYDNIYDVRKAFIFLNQRVYDKIANQYPDLKEECQRQAREPSFYIL